MGLETAPLIIAIISCAIAIFVGRKVHPFFYPDKRRLIDSIAAGARVKRTFGNYEGRNEDISDSMRGAGFIIVFMAAFYGSFVGLTFLVMEFVS